tara:strand:- start:140 stop:574 length:435 start_codon:yes stop_codon:yes gene_type:complete
MTVTTANQSTTSAGYQKLVTTTITVQGGSPDFDYSTNFQMCAIHSTLTLVNETSDSDAYCQLIVNQVIDGRYIGNFAPTGANAANTANTPVTYIYPITGSFVGIPVSEANQGEIRIEIWGKTDGGTGTNVITDISHKCWSYRGA